MAFALRKRAVLQKGYRGSTTIAQFTFPFVFVTGLYGIPGGAIGELDFYVNQGLTLSGLRDRVIEFRLESDTSTRIDRYRVTVVLIGAPEKEIYGTLDRSGFHQTGAPGHSGASGYSRASARWLYPQGGPVVALPLALLLAIAAGLILLGAVIAVAIIKGASGLGDMVRWAALGAIGIGAFVLLRQNKASG